MNHKLALERAYRKIAKNIMTPTILAYHVIPNENKVVELSTGTGMIREPIYGVSVFVFDDNYDITRNKESKFFGGSKLAAQEYYNSLTFGK